MELTTEANEESFVIVTQHENDLYTGQELYTDSVVLLVFNCSSDGSHAARANTLPFAII